jgi:hypothetical protein
MFADGSNGSVELDDHQIVIRRKGIANKITQGFQGDKSIPLRSITAVQFRPAGSLMAGCIQFTIIGGQEFRGGMLQATMDENAVLFTREQQPAFEHLRRAVEEAVSTGGGVPAQAGNAAELQKLAELVERGFLTREEFEAQKQGLLSGPAGRPVIRLPEPELPQPAFQAQRTGMRPFTWAVLGCVGLVVLASYAGSLIPA